MTEHLWGWQVTVPEAVDGAKWQEMYETYVADRNQIGVKEKFRQGKNLLAYQAIVDKMLVAINKGYWQADPQVKAHLEQVNRETIAEAGVACNAASCSSQEITAAAEAQDRQAMAEAHAMPAPGRATRSALVGGKAQPLAAVEAKQVSSPNSPAAENTAAQSAAPRPASTLPAKPAEPAEPAKAESSIEGFEIKEQQSNISSLPPAARNWALAGFAVLVMLGFALKARRRSSRLS